MAAVNVKAALTQNQFPLNSDNFVDCVLRDAGFEQERLTKDFDNQPQAYFMQNVMPQTRGYTSIHYTQVVTESTYPVYMDKILQLRDEDGSVALLSPARGNNLIYTAATSSWVSHAFPVTFSGAVSIAYLKGKTYVCYEGYGLYSYDFALGTFNEETLIGGILIADVIGVAAAGNYLILYTTQYIAYSSPIAPLDFTVALGAGGQSKILANKGKITTVLQVGNGVIVHTTVDAIYGQLTGNANFPFQFKEIPNSSGVADSEHVSYDSTNDSHVAWTTAGIMVVSTQRAELLWPELSDLLAMNAYPVAGSSALGYFPQLRKLQQTQVKVTAVGSRYIAISIKDSADANEFSIAYVYDLSLQRWGRLDVPHIDLFEYRAPEFRRGFLYDELPQTYDMYPTPYSELSSVIDAQNARFGATFGVVRKSGSVFVALTSDYTDVQILESDAGAATPVLIMGKYKLVRRQAIMAQQVWPALLHDATVTAVAHGVDGEAVKIKELVESSREATWNGRIHGSAVSFTFRGRFSLTSLAFSLEPIGSGLQVTAVTPAIPAGTIYVGVIPVVVSSEYVVL